MRRGVVLLLVALSASLAIILAGGASGGSDEPLIIKDAATGKLKPGTLTTTVTNKGKSTTVSKQTPFLSAGIVQTALDELRAEESDQTSDADLIGMAPTTNGCSNRNLGKNVRVNQDCTFRRQAEEDIVSNPTDATNLVGGQNDSRVGFNQCGISWSVDNGLHWGDLLPPFRNRINAPESVGTHTVQGGIGSGHTYDAFSDPSVAFDAAGNSYFSCVGFDINSNASVVLVTQSPAVAKGSFFFNVPQSGTQNVVAEDNSGPGHTEFVAHDKEFIAADFYPS